MTTVSCLEGCAQVLASRTPALGYSAVEVLVVKPSMSGIAFASALAVVAGLSEGCTSTCTGSLADVGASCPATFDGTPEQLPPCTGLPVNQSVHLCGDLIVLSMGGYAGITCYYEGTSLTLVGARLFSDTADFCGDSFSKTAGRTPACNEPPAFQRQCPYQTATDAGSYD